MNTSNHDKLFDLSYLNQIFQGNQEMVHKIIQLFLEQVPEYIQEMENCLTRNDLLALHPLAHKAKSSIAMLGLKSLEEKVLRIESDSKAHRNLDVLPDLVHQLQIDCMTARQQMADVLQSS